MATTKVAPKAKAKKANPLTPEGSASMPEAFLQTIRDRFLGTSPDQIDIIDLIKEDHKPLKELIPLLKSESANFKEKKAAFKLFAAALVAHAKPEEESWYVAMKATKEMKIDGHEGDIEHSLSDQLTEELKTERSQDVFMAKVKVLAELLEHHIQEEESDMIPEYKSNTTGAQRQKVGAKYLKLRAAYLTH